MPILRRLAKEQGVVTPLVVFAVAITMTFGGGGIGHPLPELFVQICVAVIAALWLWKIPESQFRAIPKAVWVVGFLLLVVPLVQLVPLPPQVWHSLPGRQIEVDSLALIGRADTWRPLSMDPALSFSSLLSMVSAAMVLVMVASIGRSGRTLVLGVVLVVALLSLVPAVVQLNGAPDSIFAIYPANGGKVRLRGFQNNPNSQADVLLVAMLCAAAFMRDLVQRHILPDQRWLVIGLVGVADLALALAVVLTGSRTGIMMLPLVVAGQIALIRPWLKLRWANLFISLAGVCAIAAGTYSFLPDTSPLMVALDRFSLDHDTRPQIWTNSLYAARQMLPAGAGMGTFVPVFNIYEPAEAVADTYVNRAHNDYLELLLEAGYAGVIAFGAIAILLVVGVVKGLMAADKRSRGQLFCATLALCVIGLHSLVDYPLRSMSLAGIAALCAAILLNPKANPADYGK